MPLRDNAALDRYAQARANREAAADVYFGDAGAVPLDVGPGYTWSILGENDAVCWGFPDPVGHLLAQWRASAPHRANEVDPAFADVGVGVTTSRGGVTYGVVLFGAPA